MSSQAAPAIVIRGIADVNPLQSATQIALGRFKNQVIVIGHQTVAVNQHVELPCHPRQARDEALLITHIGNDRLATMTSIHHMVKGTRIFNTQWSCHECIVTDLLQKSIINN